MSKRHPPDQHILQFSGSIPDAGARSHSGRRAHYFAADGELWLVEAEPVGDRGRFPATGDPQLGQDP
jgi:hypothetical protein